MDGSNTLEAIEQIEDMALTKKRMTDMVKDKVCREHMTYTEAVLSVCEDRCIDPADIGNVISPIIKGKIEAEAVKANMIKQRDCRLPI